VSSSCHEIHVLTWRAIHLIYRSPFTTSLHDLLFLEILKNGFEVLLIVDPIDEYAIA